VSVRCELIAAEQGDCHADVGVSELLVSCVES
jgi:hypothetical protein